MSTDRHREAIIGYTPARSMARGPARTVSISTQRREMKHTFASLSIYKRVKMRAFASKVVRSLGCLRLRSGSLPAWRISGTRMTVLMLSFFSRAPRLGDGNGDKHLAGWADSDLVTNINGPADAQQTSFTGMSQDPTIMFSYRSRLTSVASIRPHRLPQTCSIRRGFSTASSALPTRAPSTPLKQLHSGGIGRQRHA
jgi:hypothetical protein